MVAGCNQTKVSENCYAGPAPIPYLGQVEKLKALGIKTIINVRTNKMKHVERHARALGMNYYQIQSGVFKVPQDKEIQEFVDIVANPENQPVYVCCTLGTDRTAYYVACYRMACLDWTDDKAITTMDEGLKHWWPIFNKYKKFLRRHSEMMRTAAAKWKDNSVQVVSTDQGPIKQATEYSQSKQ
jgi:Protein tyrosine/serine phosphatase